VVEVIEIDARDGEILQFLESRGVFHVLERRPGKLRFESEGHETGEAARFILQLPQASEVIDPVLVRLEMTEKHRRRATHAELVPMMFGNYRRLIYLAQTDDEDLRQRARAAAGFLGLEYEERRTGYGELQPSLVQFVNVGTHA
jgi:hypothetical protein